MLEINNAIINKPENKKNSTENKGNIFSHIPPDIFIPSPKTDLDKNPEDYFKDIAKNISKKILTNIKNCADDINEKITARNEVSKALEKSNLFKDEKKLQKEILKDIEDYDYKDVIKKIELLDQKGLIGNNNASSATHNLLKNKYVNAEQANRIYTLVSHDYAVADEDLEETRNSHFFYATKSIEIYENFDNLTTSEKEEFIGFDIDLQYSNNEIENMKKLHLEDMSLYNDIINAGSINGFIEELRYRMLTGGVQTIDSDITDIQKLTDLDGVLSYDKLSSSLNNTNFNDYKNGIPLKYTRNEFISEFQNQIKNLKDSQKEEVYKHFQFKIDDKSDIIGYPIMKDELPEDLDAKTKEAIKKCNQTVTKYIYENSVQLPENKDLEETINTIIKACPEFITIIGKKDHRYEAIDCHTFKVLQNAMNNPEVQDLTPQEQRIISLAILFHDFAKKQEAVDPKHPYESAKYVNQICKKLDILPEEQERIYNLVQHSHWLEELNKRELDTEDIALIFKNPNDFKMARIIVDSDINSNNSTKMMFGHALNTMRSNEIEQKIDEIHNTGALLYNTKFPVDQSKFDRNEEGIKILDFTNRDLDLGQYGFEEGMTPMQVKSYIHRPGNCDSAEKMLTLCDNKQNVILSTILYDNPDKYFNYTWNNSPYALILDTSNTNIVLGGPTLSCTGGQRDFEYYKNVVFNHNEKDNEINFLYKNRATLSDIIKKSLDINDEEYQNLYKEVANIESIEKIPETIKISETRTITKEEFKNAMDDLYKEMFNPENLKIGNQYQNEVCLYRPKVQAFVIKKSDFENSRSLQDEKQINDMKETAKKHDIPIVLI